MSKQVKIALEKIIQGLQMLTNEIRPIQAKSRHFRITQKSSKKATFYCCMDPQGVLFTSILVNVTDHKIAKTGSPEIL